MQISWSEGTCNTLKYIHLSKFEISAFSCLIIVSSNAKQHKDNTIFFRSSNPMHNMLNQTRIWEQQNILQNARKALQIQLIACQDAPEKKHLITLFSCLSVFPVEFLLTNSQELNSSYLNFLSRLNYSQRLARWRHFPRSKSWYCANNLSYW